MKQITEVVEGYNGLRTSYFEHLISRHSRVVCAEPCGEGKTLGIAEFISQHYKEGVLYVAERIEQLETMYELLINLGVEPTHIGVLHSKTEEFNHPKLVRS